ncbi:MAG: radical SAM protein [Elusimicrobia bacterium]|nr:radical SAM protein [Elusimicrobiota bacterium]
MNIYTDNFLFFSDRTINIFGLGTVIGKKYKAASILTGRGCPYNCHFCSKSFSGFRFRSINNLIEELNYLKENYNINAVHFSDELAVWNRERTLELIQKIKPLNLLWDCQGRANTVDYDLLKKMKGAGCVGIGFGIESGSNEILKRMNKKITVEQSERAMKAALRAGLMVKVQMMIGYPGETRETVMQTVDLMKRCHSYGRRLAITTPLPGSQLYDDCKSQGFIKNEAEYLEKLIVGYGGDTILVNFTNMSDEELVELKREAEQMMVANYVKYLLWHPIKLLEALLPILKDYVEFFFLYLKNQEIRKKTHRFIKKRILNVLS